MCLTSQKLKTCGFYGTFYKSKDLKSWEGPYKVFTVPEDNWITGGIWAPEVHQYRGKYYLFATINSTIEFKKERKDWGAKYTYRGTQIFHADSPMGPFLPFADILPHTRHGSNGIGWNIMGRRGYSLPNILP